MELEQHNYSVEEAQENSLKDVLLKYFHHWKWFAASLALSVLLCSIYLRYQTPNYEVVASILIKDDKKGDISSELSAFEDLGILKNNKNIDNEIEILKSRSLMTKVVKELKLNILYFSYGRPIEHERYSDTPIRINILNEDSTQITQGNWLVIPESDKKFLLKNGIDNETIGTYKFGDTVAADFGELTFVTTSFFTNSYLNKGFRIAINPMDVTVSSYLSKIRISPVNKTSNAITISLRNAVVDKATDVVNNLIKQHNLDAIEDKNQISKNTANFINERINYITNELSLVEGEAESFKTKYKLTDVESEAKLFLQSGSAGETGLLETNTQMRVAEFMNDYVQKHTSLQELIPTNLGLSDAPLSLQINEYNKLVLERNRILKNSSEKNPVVENLNNQLIDYRKSIKESLGNLKASLQIKTNELSKKEAEINSKIASVPKYEKEYRIIQRQQQIKEALYLYLLQKREETNIALAVTVANAKIIDKAYSDGNMVSPKKQIAYLSAFLIGLVLPIVILYLLDLLDTKVHGKSDIDKVKLPFLGDIPKSNIAEKLVVIENDHSNIAEAFRLLRTNVEFINANRINESKTIFVTSTIGKEGKSFIALNLAASFALSGKKTLLIGSDLRAPKILAYLGLADKKGLTNYITDKTIKLSDIIFNVMGMNNFYVLPPGPIPPNPAELLMHPRVKEMFEEAKPNYDYVIVDTAPVGLVADTLLLNTYADCTVFVVRANFIDKRLLRIAETMYKEKRLPNLAVLINDSDYKRGYGYGYGYGYGQENEIPFWKRFLRNRKGDKNAHSL